MEEALWLDIGDVQLFAGVRMAESGKTPAFQFYPNDWLSSTKIALMTPAEEGAYIHLLCYAWNDPDCTIPDDDSQLASLSRLGEGWFNGGSTKIRKCFEPHPEIEGRLINIRLIQEREKQDVWREKSRQGGLKSAAKRWGYKGKHKSKGGNDLVTTKSKPKGNSSSSSSSSSSNIHIYSERTEQKNGSIPYPEIVQLLNTRSDKHFQVTETTKKHIHARWAEGARFPDFEYVIDVKCEEWLGTENDKYIRPETLFGTKFHSYRNQKRITTQQRCCNGMGFRDSSGKVHPCSICGRPEE